MPEKTEEKQGSRWPKGKSGNPSGRPRGSRNRTTLAVEELLAGEAESITRKAVELALGGDTTALRLCLERLAPPVRERPIDLDLPRLEGPINLPEILASLIEAVGEGRVTTSEAERLAKLVNAYSNAFELRDMEERLRFLEGRT